MKKYRVAQREGPAHGGLYELDQEFFIDVVENKTNTIVMTFQSEGYATFQGPGWGGFDHSGVEKIELAPDEKSVLVYAYGAHEPKRVNFPQ